MAHAMQIDASRRAAWLRRSAVATALVAALCLCGGWGGAASAKSVALVIGNDGYRNVEKLHKASGDARALGETLRQIGFTVTVETDVDNRRFTDVLARFVKSVEPGDTAFFHFSGHGVEIDGRNFLLPVDAPSPSESNDAQLQRASFELQREVLAALRDRHPRALVAVIDACRNNPYSAQPGGRSVGGERGLARVDAASGEFLIFSAAPKQAALDELAPGDTEQTSVFMRVFLKYLPQPNVPLQAIVKSTQTEVYQTVLRATNNTKQQRPNYDDQFIGDLLLNQQQIASLAPTVPKPPAVAPPITLPPPLAAPAAPLAPAAPAAAPSHAPAVAVPEGPPDRPGAASDCALSLAKVRPDVSGVQWITIESSCGTLARIYLTYGDWTFVRAVDPAASVTFPFAFFAGASELKVSTNRGGQVSVPAPRTQPRYVKHVVLLWTKPVDLDLVPADPEFVDPQNVERFAWQASVRLADGGPGTTRAVVYTLAPKQTPEGHAIKFRVNNRSRAQVPQMPFCGGGGLDQVAYEARLYEDGRLAREPERQATPRVACGQAILADDLRAPRLRNINIVIRPQS
jgi:hypothetical protein